MIRALLLSDIDDLMPLLLENYRLAGDTPIYGLADETTIKEALSRFMKRSDFFSWVTQNDAREITGVIAWLIHPNTYSSGECASEMIWYAKKPRDMIRLMKFSLNRIPENLYIAVGHYPDNRALQKWLVQKGFMPSRLVHVKKRS